MSPFPKELAELEKAREAALQAEIAKLREALSPAPAPRTPTTVFGGFRVIESPLVPDGVVRIAPNRIAEVIDALNALTAHVNKDKEQP